jgi:hypothetical protein
MTYIGWTLSLSAAATVGLVRVRRREGPAAVVPGLAVGAVHVLVAVTVFALAKVIAAPRDCLLGLGTLLLVVLLARLRRNRGLASRRVTTAGRRRGAGADRHQQQQQASPAMPRSSAHEPAPRPERRSVLPPVRRPSMPAAATTRWSWR